jgi:hypothetical protein
MSWKDIDLFEIGLSSFSEELYEVIVPFYEQGSAKLQEWEQQRRELLDKMLNEAKDDEGEVQYANGLVGQIEWRNKQKGQILGAATLHFVYSTLKINLRQLARYFNETHPRTPESYKGKSELDRLREEFAQRFGIDFEKAPFFNSARELALARNAGIHSNIETLREYKRQVISPRFCNDGEFCVEREAFYEILGEMEKFFGWAANELLQIRKASHIMKKPSEGQEGS